jgi:hypothetical protein
MAKTGLEDFKQVLKSFHELGSLAIKGTVALPLVNLWSKLGPPPTAGVSLMTSATQFLAVMSVFHFWQGVAPRRLNFRMKVSAIVFCVALCASGVLIDRFTSHPRPHSDPIVCGYRLRPDVRPLISASYTASDALRDAEYDAERVWTPGSITLIHAVLIACWLLTFVSVSVFTSTFIILQKRSQLRKQAVAQGRVSRH